MAGIPEGRPAVDGLPLQEDLVGLIMDAAPILISYIGVDRRYRYNNRAYEEWFGHSRAEITGRTLWDVLGGPAYQAIKPMVDAALAGRKQTWESHIPYKDGGARYVRGHYLPHFLPDGSVDGFVVFIMDFTERRGVEELLLERERFLESIYNGAEESIFVVDVSPEMTFTYAGFNPAYRRLAAGYGHDPGRVIGSSTRSLRAIFPSWAVDNLEERYRRCAESRTPQAYEETVEMDGRTTWWYTRLTPLADEQGRVYRLIGTSVDISRRTEDDARIRHAEAQLRQSQKMEAIGRLAGGIAHDFNNLLTAINGYASLLLETLPGGGPGRGMAEEIVRAGEKAARLTNQLLAFSRKQILDPKVIDLNQVVTGMETLLRRVIGEDIDLVAELSGGLTAVRMDPGQLEQIILNLAINSRDAMPEGGRITLKTYPCDVESLPPGANPEARPGPHAVLAVRDSGAGMPPEVRERLFEPFFTTKAPGKGTGMGLATVYGIVRQSGGHIQVETVPGNGTEFRIFLPAVQAFPDGRSGQAAGSAEGGSGGRTLLLVEDEPPVRNFVARVLEGKGYRVLSASHGKEALDILDRLDGEGASVELLITDLVMPEMGGEELWRKVSGRYPALRVLFMSGYTETSMIPQARSEQAAPFLAKPFSPSQLLSKVAEVLSAPAQAS